MPAIRKIVIAPTAFKGSLDPVEVALAMERGVRRTLPGVETVVVPLADGGDGMLRCLAQAGVCALQWHPLHDALCRLHKAPYGISPNGETGFIEVAQICGLAQLRPEERDPRRTTTLGVGEMIEHLLQQGVRDLVIGLGGSATNDGGSGALVALGWQLLDRQGNAIAPNNAGLSHVHRVIPASCERTDIEVTLAADVRNPLLGRQGATMVFAPQKGATVEMLPELERAMRRWAIAVHRAIGQKISQIPGTGAAGGLAFGLLAHFPQAQISSGADLVMQTVGFEDALREADLVLTGEGRVDETTLHGKLVSRVLRTAKKWGVPVAIICGDFVGEHSALAQYGVLTCQTLVSEAGSLEEAMRRTADLLEEKSAKLFKQI
ncbi:MAG: glycerate kinase [Armatimonadota bacterium]